LIFQVFGQSYQLFLFFCGDHIVAQPAELFYGVLPAKGPGKKTMVIFLFACEGLPVFQADKDTFLLWRIFLAIQDMETLVDPELANRAATFNKRFIKEYKALFVLSISSKHQKRPKVCGRIVAVFIFTMKNQFMLDEGLP
jgi:hypothetical protein